MKYDFSIDFKSLIPPLSKEEYNLLRKSILKDGCRDAIVVWTQTLSTGEQGSTIILDGHNRYEICKKHNITKGSNLATVMDFVLKNEEEVKDWIICNQLARRNLPTHERVRLALLLKPAIEEKAKEKEIEGGKKKGLMNSSKAPVHTRKKVAKTAGVSEDTVRKSEIIEKEATEETKTHFALEKLDIKRVPAMTAKEILEKNRTVLEKLADRLFNRLIVNNLSIKVEGAEIEKILSNERR